MLESKEFERVGDSTPIKVDIRVIAATNRNLKELVAHGDFREDLYYRLKVFEIHLPPLRERREDIPALVSHFLHRFNVEMSKRLQGVDDAVMDLFLRHRWPGNVRELENTLEHAFVLTRRQDLHPEDLPSNFMKATGPASTPGAGDPTAEVRAIFAALEQSSYNKSEAARLLGISRRTLYRKLEQHRITV